MNLAILNIRESCTGCGACVNICPKGCLKLGTDEYGFYYPLHNAELCVECGMCERTCHIINPIDDKPIEQNGFHYYIAKDERIVEKSSSGGVFSAFAEYIIDNGGIVFGSYYNGESRRLEVSNSEEVDWKLFRKSKYIESYMGDTCRQIALNIKKERKVLFCGTPCQVRGIRNYLQTRKISQDNLLLIDFVCHGVPTNSLYTSFLNKYGLKKQIKNIDFRYKDFSTKSCGWHDFVMNISYYNGSQQLIPYYPPYSFYYLNLFSNDCAHRLSCIKCNCIDYSMADVTIGDFWGVNKFKPELDENKGISLVKIHNDKSYRIWEQIKDKGKNGDVQYNYASYLYNKKDRLYNIKRRNQFLNYYIHYGLNKAVFKTNKRVIIDYYTIFQIKRLIKIILRKNTAITRIKTIK